MESNKTSKKNRYALKNIDWVNTAFLVITPIVGISLTAYHLAYEAFSWSTFAVTVVFYFITGFSITAGYHRLFSHKAYKAHPVVKLFFLIFGAATFQNSLLKWASDHRRHHGKVDTEHDPYNINEGFFYAHMGWVMLKAEDRIENVKDLQADPLVMWQHRNYLLISSLAGLFLPGLIGWYFGSFAAGFGLAAFGRVAFVHHATFFINSLCHYMGKQTYSDTHSAKDSFLMALFTYGEGYHNFHHEFQIDYRNGIKWYHYDPTKWLIWALSKLGLSWDLKVVKESEILKASLIMKEKQLANQDMTVLIQLREAVLHKLSTLIKLQKDYQAKKREGIIHSVHLKEQWIAEIKRCKKEFEESLHQWHTHYGHLQLSAA